MVARFYIIRGSIIVVMFAYQIYFRLVDYSYLLLVDYLFLFGVFSILLGSLLYFYPKVKSLLWVAVIKGIFGIGLSIWTVYVSSTVLFSEGFNVSFEIYWGVFAGFLIILLYILSFKELKTRLVYPTKSNTLVESDL